MRRNCSEAITGVPPDQISHWIVFDEDGPDAFNKLLVVRLKTDRALRLKYIFAAHFPNSILHNRSDGSTAM
jgi:hypothetical protein